MMTARGTSRRAFLASAPNAVHDSKPTRMRIATVDCINTLIRFLGSTIEAAEGCTNSAWSGLATRYQIASAEKPTRATS